jgi:nucleotide-binding universal stress UspA family protein
VRGGKGSEQPKSHTRWRAGAHRLAGRERRLAEVIPSHVVAPLLVGSNLAETSDSALIFALRLASLLDVRLVVVHVVESTPLPKGKRAPLGKGERAAVRKVIDWHQASAKQLLIRQLRRVGGGPEQAELEVRSGTPAVELLAAARRRRATLLVLGTGDGGPGHVGLRVLAATRVPVVIVPRSARQLPAGRLAKHLHLLPPLARPRKVRNRRAAQRPR